MHKWVMYIFTVSEDEWIHYISVCFRMVPTSVERLREGQGVLERVLRGNMKMDRILKRSDGGASEHDSNRDKDLGME